MLDSLAFGNGVFIGEEGRVLSCLLILVRHPVYGLLPFFVGELGFVDCLLFVL